MRNAIHVEISQEPLDIQRAYAAVSDSAHGGIDMFIGAVRNCHEGHSVKGVTYDVHKTLAEKALRDICEESLGIWPDTRYYVSHYQGTLEVGGISVVVAVSAAHRAEAFDACRFVIDELKKRAPVWKKEHYPEGESAWLPGHSLVAEARGQTTCCGKCNADG